MLPSYLPRTRIETPRRNYMRASAIALPLRQMNQLAAKVNSSGTSAKELLGLTQSQMLVVLGFENDEYLEQVWPAKKRRPLLDAIKVVDPDVAIAWNYSVWHRHSSGWLYPRPEHLYNIKRSMKIYAELQGIGVRAIPHVYWGLRDDLERWADWLRDNPCVSTIAIDLQTADSDQDWRSIKSDISHFTRILPRRIKVLFSGVCHIDRWSILEPSGRISPLQLWPCSRSTSDSRRDSDCNRLGWRTAPGRMQRYLSLQCVNMRIFLSGSTHDLSLKLSCGAI